MNCAIKWAFLSFIPGILGPQTEEEAGHICRPEAVDLREEKHWGLVLTSARSGRPSIVRTAHVLRRRASAARYFCECVSARTQAAEREEKSESHQREEVRERCQVPFLFPPPCFSSERKEKQTRRKKNYLRPYVEKREEEKVSWGGQGGQCEKGGGVKEGQFLHRHLRLSRHKLEKPPPEEDPRSSAEDRGAYRLLFHGVLPA